MNTRTDTIERVGRIIAIVGVFVGGAMHLRLYDDGYRDIPNYMLGRSFLANVVASGVVVALLATWRSQLALLAGLGIAVGTLGAFVKSRTGTGIFGFTESGLEPSPEAVIALVVAFGLQLKPDQIGAILAVTAVVLGLITRSRVSPA